MSASFVWISHDQGLEPTKDIRLSTALESWVPFKPERKNVWEHKSGKASVWCWETHDEGVRGQHYTEQGRSSVALSMTGWWREPDAAPLSLSVAEVMLYSLMGRRVSSREAKGFEQGLADFAPKGGWAAESSGDYSSPQLDDAIAALHLSPGQFAAGFCDHDGVVHGVNSSFGGCPLYYAEGYVTVHGHTSRTAILSNRASLVSLCLHGERPALPRPEVLGWLLARSEHPIGDDEVPFPHVKRLHAGQSVQLANGSCKLRSIPLPQAKSYSDQTLFDSLVWRVGQLARIPHLPIKMALTGGFDSRMVLAGLLGAGLTNRIDEFFIHAHPDHADTRVARELAASYQLPFRRYDAGRWQAVDEPLLNRLRRHNYLTEYLCSAWDIMSGPESQQLENYGAVSGHFGELFRGHAYQFMSRSWSTLIGYYRSHRSIDRHTLLSHELICRYAQLSQDWLASRRSDGVKSDFALDELHRHARMEGWATQCRQVESLGYPNFAPLACVSTRANYEALPMKDRERPTIPFNIIRQVDDCLWRIPFAKKSWPKSFMRREKVSLIPPMRGGGTELGYQMKIWQAEVDDLSDWLLNGRSDHPFWIVCDREKLKHKLLSTRKRPTSQRVKSLMSACAVKLALDQPLTPVQLSRYENDEYAL